MNCNEWKSVWQLRKLKQFVLAFAVPEHIILPPTEEIEISWHMVGKGRGLSKTKMFKENVSSSIGISSGAVWGLEKQLTSVGEVWVCYTGQKVHCNFERIFKKTQLDLSFGSAFQVHTVYHMHN